MPSHSVGELCSRYTTLDNARAALDEHIQRIQGGVTAQDNDAQDDALEQAPGTAAIEGADRPRAGPEPAFDTLWMELDAILAQQAALIGELANTGVATTDELRQKAVILGVLLQGDNATQESLASMLSRSVVRDIISQGAQGSTKSHQDHTISTG